MRSATELIASCVVYSLIIALGTLAVLFVFTQDLNRVIPQVSLAFLLEGGLALVVGGVVASFSSTIGKVSEGLFRSKPWDARRQKEAEKQARVWIVTGICLVFAGFLVSAL